MDIEFDPAKNERNIRERGLSFETVADFDFETTLIIRDDRRGYGEVRMRALGYLEDRLHVLVFTIRGEKLRVISLRANAREVVNYEKQTQS